MSEDVKKENEGTTEAEQLTEEQQVEKEQAEEEEVEYEVSEVRVEGDTVLLVLTREGDGFGVSIPYSQYTNMSEEELDAFLEEQVRERLRMLEQVKRQEEENKVKLRQIEAIKGHKIKYRRRVRRDEYGGRSESDQATNQ